MEITHTVDIIKVDEDRRLFGGWAYVARDASGRQVVDHSGDVVDTDEAWNALKDAALRYAVEVRAGDDMHRDFGVAKLAEFMVWDEEKREQLGIEGGPQRAIFTSFRAEDTPEGEAYWQKIKRGDVKALSIVGRGRREAL